MQDESKSLTPTEKEISRIVQEIQQTEPGYKPPETTGKVIDIRPLVRIEHLVPITVDQLEAMDVPPIEYVLYPCLPTQGICFIYAASGIGKTLFTLNLAYAIAQGGSFLKYQCPKPRKILYIDGEMSFNQLHARMMNIIKHSGELHFKENLSILTPDKILPHRMPNIDDEYGQSIYEQIMSKYDFEVIVFDNVSMLTTFDENKAEEWKSLQDWLLRLRSLGKSVFVVHHAGKDKNGYRGSSRMLDCANTAISLQPIQDEGLEEDNVSAKKFKVVYQKSRDFGGKDALPYEVVLEHGIWSHQSVEQTNITKIADRINCGMSQTSIAKELGVSQPYVNKLIKKARVIGLITK